MKASLVLFALVSASVAFASPLPAFSPSPAEKRQSLSESDIEVDRAQPFRASAFDPSSEKRAVDGSQPFKYKPSSGSKREVLEVEKRVDGRQPFKSPPGSLGKREKEEELKMDKLSFPLLLLPSFASSWTDLPFLLRRKEPRDNLHFLPLPVRPTPLPPYFNLN